MSAAACILYRATARSWRRRRSKRGARCGPTTPTSTSSTTSATRRCRRQGTSISCSGWLGGSPPSGSIAQSRCGRCGSWRASRATGSRLSAKRTTRWWMASQASTWRPCCSTLSSIRHPRAWSSSPGSHTGNPPRPSWFSPDSKDSWARRSSYWSARYGRRHSPPGAQASWPKRQRGWGSSCGPGSIPPLRRP